MVVADSTKYSIILDSDVDRDGMYLELSETESKKVIAEVFYSDRTHDFSITCFQEEMPMNLIDLLIQDAKRLLPPASE